MTRGLIKVLSRYSTQIMDDVLKELSTNADDDTHRFMMFPQVLVYMYLQFRPNAITREQMDCSGELSGTL